MTPEQKNDLIENIIALIICILIFPIALCFELVRLNSKSGKFFK